MGCDKTKINDVHRNYFVPDLRNFHYMLFIRFHSLLLLDFHLMSWEIHFVFWSSLTQQQMGKIRVENVIFVLRKKPFMSFLEKFYYWMRECHC